MESRRFQARGNRGGLFWLEKSTRIATTFSFWGGTALADLKGHVSVPFLTMRAYSAVLWLWGLVSSPWEEFREFGMEV